MATETVVPIPAFRGLNNREDRTKLGLDWFEIADNVSIDDLSGIELRPGCTSIATSVADMHARRDGKRSFFIRSSDNALLDFNGTASTVIFDDVGSGPYCWTDAENITFLMGRSSGVVIYPDRVEPWGITPPNKPTLTRVPGGLPAGDYQVVATYVNTQGRESGATSASKVTVTGSDSINMEIDNVPSGYTVNWWVTPTDGRQLLLATRTSEKQVTWHGPVSGLAIPLKTQFFYPPPKSSESIAFYQGRVWVAIYDQVRGFTRVFSSEPLEYHYYQLDGTESIDVQGRVTLLAGTPAGLLIGSDRAIHVYSSESGLRTVAEYGAVKSRAAFDDDSRCYLWTERGWCIFPGDQGSFQNLSEDIVSFDSGAQASVLVREANGYRQVIAAPSTEGSPAFNQNIPMINIT